MCAKLRTLPKKQKNLIRRFSNRNNRNFWQKDIDKGPLMNMRGGSILLLHNKVSGGVQYSQIMISSFFDRFYVMPPLTNGVHYTRKNPECVRCVDLEKTFNCALAKAVRQHLHRLGLKGTGCRAVFSTEAPIKSAVYDPETMGGNKRSVLGTSSCMPTVFGCHCAAEVLRRITENS